MNDISLDSSHSMPGGQSFSGDGERVITLKQAERVDYGNVMSVFG